MKKIIFLILFLLFGFNAGSAYSFNYSKAKCAIVPSSHSLKLKMSADVYNFSKKYVPFNINKRFSKRYAIANRGTSYMLVVRTTQVVNNLLHVFLFRNGSLVGTYDASYYPRGIFTSSVAHRSIISKLSPFISIVPRQLLCYKFFGNYNYDNNAWNYYPIIPALVEKITRDSGRKKISFVYVHRHIQMDQERTIRLSN